MLGGEGLVHQNLVVSTAFDIAPPAQKDVVQRVHITVGNRHQAAGRRLVQARHIERDLDHDAGIDLRDARDVADPCTMGERCPLETGEHIGEAIPVVIRGLRRFQRIEGRQVHGEHGDPGADHQGDGDRLGLQVPQVAQQLAFQRAHRLTTEVDRPVRARRGARLGRSDHPPCSRHDRPSRRSRRCG